MSEIQNKIKRPSVFTRCGFGMLVAVALTAIPGLLTVELQANQLSEHIAEKWPELERPVSTGTLFAFRGWNYGMLKVLSFLAGLLGILAGIFWQQTKRSRVTSILLVLLVPLLAVNYQSGQYSSWKKMLPDLIEEFQEEFKRV